MNENPIAGDAGPAGLDTSGMNAGKRRALELAESARDPGNAAGAFCGGLFLGRFQTGALHPFPTRAPSPEAAAFLAALEAFLRDHTDPDEIDRTGEIPAAVVAGLRRLGAFGIKIPKEYGGLGLSQTDYCRAAMVLGSWCGNQTALLSAHQSIGLPQPLLMFGTEAQRRAWLPRLAAGEISAFALTERQAGSDPARIETRAEPDGPDHFLITGEKLWCTNGVTAGVIVVMARTPGEAGRTPVTAFIVPMDAPGVSVTHRCRFMGLRALYNAVIRFERVRVPRSAILLAEGKGMRVALATLNTGRLTLPAACVGLAERAVRIARDWAAVRTQWGAPIGEHGAVAGKLARMAADTFAMRAMTLYAASLVDADKSADIRIEAAMAKLWSTECAWRIVDDCLQIRGGRGYETAASLAARGERAEPVERMMRDCRINRVFEGSSEIMRLFIAREALDPHLRVAGPALDSRRPAAARLAAGLRAAGFYARWYPALFNPAAGGLAGVAEPLGAHTRRAGRTARRLARALFAAMVRHGPKLEREQELLGRLVDIGTELFAITTACAHAHALRGEYPAAAELADLFCRESFLRIEALFVATTRHADGAGHRVARRLLAGDFDALLLADGVAGDGG